MGKSVAQAACGSSHTLVLTTKGEIFAFGWGKDGQVGLMILHPAPKFPKNTKA